MLLAVMVDRKGKKPVEDYVGRFGFTFPVFLDAGGKARNAYLVKGIPTTHIIGKDGRFSGVAIGARDWTSEGLKRFLWERAGREQGVK